MRMSGKYYSDSIIVIYVPGLSLYLFRILSYVRLWNKQGYVRSDLYM